MKNKINILASIVIFFLAFFLLKSAKYVPKSVFVSVKAEFLDSDRFQLFYAFSDEFKYQQENSINYQVKGMKGFQIIDFEISLGENELHGLRLDISSANYQQRPISIEYVNVSNGKSEIVYDNILENFDLSPYLKYKDSKYHTSLINDKYDPYLVLKKTNSDLRSLNQSENRFSILEVSIYCLIISVLFYVIAQHLLNQKINTFSYAINITFILIILFPLGMQLLNVDENVKDLENREKIEAPKVAFSKSYFKDFEAYYNDNFPYRNTLIKHSTTIKSSIFKASPFPQKVKFGKDKFLFSNINDAYVSYSKNNLVTEKKLNDFADSISMRIKRLNAQGKQYFIGYFPNKHTVYSEFMPYSMTSQIRENSSLADQIKLKLADKGITFYDTKQELINQKSDNLLYHKLDTHWNDYGAYIGYKRFFNTYKELGVVPYDIEAFNISYMTRTWGDLTKLIGTDEIVGYEEIRPLFKLKDQSKSYKTESSKGFPTGTIRTINNNCGNNEKLIFFGDSFSVYVIQYFSLHFQEVIYIRGTFDEELIKKTNPDVIMELMVERFIYKHL